MKEVTIDTNNKEFQDALNLILYTKQSVFLTGKAGTGKSTFLKYLCETTKKRYVVLAPTGIAAINAGGSTIHSFFKLPFRPMLPDDPDLSLQNNRIFDFLKYKKGHRKLIENVDLIIIDEISMVRADVIDFMDRVLRVFSKNMREPFGGKQLLFVGDVFQLEPVVKRDEMEILGRFYPNPYFFSAHVFNEIALVPIELKKVYRQTNETFISILDAIRVNSVERPQLEILNKRCIPHFSPPKEELFITLATRRDQVDQINSGKLSELTGASLLLKGITTGDFPESSMPTLMELEIKENAQIIFIHNDFGPVDERRWVNGTLAKINMIDHQEGRIFAETEEGNIHEVEKVVWRNIRYKYNEKERRIEEEELGTFCQYPIRLAWAITVHKSQGLTFRNCIVDFTGGTFAGGQAYVALSRCTSLEGLVLRKQITHGDIFVRNEVMGFATQFNDRKLIDRSLKQAEADTEYHRASEAFDKGEMEECLQHFFKAIHSRYDIEKPLGRRFIRRKLNIVNKLRNENLMLREKLLQQTANLSKLAQEFYLMGNECIVQARDSRAAIANFDKALSLDPLLVDAWIRKGITLYDTNEYFEAEICFNEAIRLSPSYFKGLYNRGKNRLAMKNYEAAMTDLLRSIGFKKTHIAAHEYLALALDGMGKGDAAEKVRSIAEELRIKRSQEG